MCLCGAYISIISQQLTPLNCVSYAVFVLRLGSLALMKEPDESIHDFATEIR